MLYDTSCDTTDLDAKGRTLGRLAQACNDVLVQMRAQGLHKPNRRGALALTCIGDEQIRTNMY